jgi:hypothetical protein
MWYDTNKLKELNNFRIIIKRKRKGRYYGILERKE